MTSQEIRTESRDRAEQNVLEVLADGLPHIFTAGESLLKAARRLARKGVVTVTAVNSRMFAVRMR